MNYDMLRGRIRREGLTEGACARQIGLTPSHFARKLANEYPFKQGEIERMCELLHIEANDIGVYFFTPEVEKHQH